MKAGHAVAYVCSFTETKISNLSLRKMKYLRQFLNYLNRRVSSVLKVRVRNVVRVFWSSVVSGVVGEPVVVSLETGPSLR